MVLSEPILSVKTMTNKEKVLKNTIQRCKEKNIIIPTIEQQKNPEKIPAGIKKELKNIGLWDLNSRNLFRITWKNEPVKKGGGFGTVNYLEIPKELTSEGIVDEKTGRLDKTKLHQKLRELAQARQYARVMR